MKYKITLLLLLTTFISISTFAQTITEKNYAIGFVAGFSRGYNDGRLAYPEGGLSFKFIPNKIGIQTTVLPFYNENITSLSLDLNFIYSLITVETTNFYLYQGNQFVYNYHHNPYAGRYYSDSFNNGLGLGIECCPVERIGISISFGYAFYNYFTEFRRKIEGGIFYKF